MTGLPRSLKGRLLVLLLTVTTAVWIATTVATWFDAQRELGELLDGHLAQAAALLIVQQAGELDDNDRGVDAPTLHRYAPRVAFQVFHEGHLAMRSANAPNAPMIDPALGAQAGFATVQIDGTAWRVYTARGAENDVQAYVGEQLNSRDSILWAVLRSVLWPMVIALPLLALGAWWAVGRGIGPLHRLGRVLAERQPQAVHAVAVAGAPSEMAPLIAALNGLFERMAGVLALERRFTADAAHELRTPIAAIRAQAQVALAETDDTLRRLALQHTLEGCDRATRLVDQLLTLARLEAAEAPSTAVVDLAAVARSVAADLAPKAIGKRQTLELDAPAPCIVAGNDTLLGVLLRNLIDNAVRYSPPGSHIAVQVVSAGHSVRFSVDDSGPGLDASQRERLGERFFRVTGNDETGSGLGWSIVRRIADVHRISVQVEPSATLGGLAVLLTTSAAA